jgi:ankyrin repeat protein
MVITL